MKAVGHFPAIFDQREVMPMWKHRVLAAVRFLVCPAFALYILSTKAC